VSVSTLRIQWSYRLVVHGEAWAIKNKMKEMREASSLEFDEDKWRFPCQDSRFKSINSARAVARF